MWVFCSLTFHREYNSVLQILTAWHLQNVLLLLLTLQKTLLCNDDDYKAQPLVCIDLIRKPVNIYSTDCTSVN